MSSIFQLIIASVWIVGTLVHVAHSQCSNSSDNSSTMALFPDCTISYPINQDDLCQGLNHSLFIGVHSSPRNLQRRNLIRNTYGSFKRLSDKSIVVLFILGEVADDALQKEIIRESDEYGDVVQGNFLDSYRNLTLKHVALLNWVGKHCPEAQHFVKVDDDTMVDVFHLVYLLETYQFRADYLCKAIKVHVNRQGKWAVSKEEYEGTVYPDYCEGFAYLFQTVRLIPKLVEETLHTRYFWIDDVVISGIVRQKMNLGLQYFPNNFGFTDIKLVKKEDLPNFIFLRNEDNFVNTTRWYSVWQMIVVNTYDLFI